LEERQQSLAAPSIEAMIPQIGLMHLITHSYPQSLKLDRDRQDKKFARLGSLAISTQIQCIDQKDDLDEVSQLYDKILKDAESRQFGYHHEKSVGPKTTSKEKPPKLDLVILLTLPCLRNLGFA
jgi:hypothetical protein